MKRIVKKLIELYNRLYNFFVFIQRKPIFVKMPQIRGRIYFVSDTHAVTFGKDVIINSSIKSNPVGGNKTIIYAKEGAKIKIGNNVGISNSVLCAAKLIEIEDDVMIGDSCKIYDTDFHSIEFENRIQKPDINVSILPVIIKRGAFIGAQSIILKGVTIGEESVVGAGSVVTKNIPNREIWAGNPARFVRKIN